MGAGGGAGGGSGGSGGPAGAGVGSGIAGASQSGIGAAPGMGGGYSGGGGQNIGGVSHNYQGRFGTPARGSAPTPTYAVKKTTPTIAPTAVTMAPPTAPPTPQAKPNVGLSSEIGALVGMGIDPGLAAALVGAPIGANFGGVAPPSAPSSTAGYMGGGPTSGPPASPNTGATGGGFSGGFGQANPGLGIGTGGAPGPSGVAPPGAGGGGGGGGWGGPAPSSMGGFADSERGHSTHAKGFNASPSFRGGHVSNKAIGDRVGVETTGRAGPKGDLGTRGMTGATPSIQGGASSSDLGGFIGQDRLGVAPPSPFAGWDNTIDDVFSGLRQASNMMRGQNSRAAFQSSRVGGVGGGGYRQNRDLRSRFNNPASRGR